MKSCKRIVVHGGIYNSAQKIWIYLRISSKYLRLDFLGSLFLKKEKSLEYL